MKKKITQLLTAGILCSISNVAAAQEVPGFPGAEGFGKYTSGGRGGKVYTVTKLSDDGSEGTLRYALKSEGFEIYYI